MSEVATHPHGHPTADVATSAPATEGSAATNGSPISFEVNEFEEGEYKGFKYTTPVHNITGRTTSLTVDEGTKTAIERYGEATLLALFDAQVLGRIRTKVKNGLRKGLKPAELAAEHQSMMQKHPDGILFSEQEALAWKPDVRELSPNQLFKKAKEYFNEAGKETDMAKKVELMQKGQQCLVEMGKVLAS